MRTYRCVASQPKLSCLQASGLSGHLTIPHVGQLAARLFLGKILGIFVGQIPLRTSGRQTGSCLPLNGTAKTQSLDVVQSSLPNYHVGLDLLIQLTKHHAELSAQKPQSSLWHEPLKSPQASIFSGWKEVEIAPPGRPKDCRCHVLCRAGTA